MISNSSQICFSVAESSALVASSKRNIYAFFFNRLRAMTTLWRSPPERFPPRSPTCESYPSYIDDIFSCIWHFLHTSITSSIVHSGLLYFKFSRTEALKSVPPWGTIAMYLRKLWNFSFEMSYPSRRILPFSVSNSLINRLKRVVLSNPYILLTIAFVVPGYIFKLKSFNNTFSRTLNILFSFPLGFPLITSSTSSFWLIWSGLSST